MNIVQIKLTGLFHMNNKLQTYQLVSLLMSTGLNVKANQNGFYLDVEAI